MEKMKNGLVGIKDRKDERQERWRGKVTEDGWLKEYEDGWETVILVSMEDWKDIKTEGSVDDRARDMTDRKDREVEQGGQKEEKVEREKDR